MSTYLAGRIGSLVLSLLVASIVIFVVVEIVPGDPAQFMLGLNARQRRSVEGTAYEKLLTLDRAGQACITECLRKDGNVRMQSVSAKGPDGRTLVLDISALPVRNDAGAISGVVVLHRDVTDEQGLRDKYDRLQAEQTSERESLLRIINDRDAELKKLKSKVTAR